MASDVAGIKQCRSGEDDEQNYSDNEVTAVSVIDQISHFDNKE